MTPVGRRGYHATCSVCRRAFTGHSCHHKRVVCIYANGEYAAGRWVRRRCSPLESLIAVARLASVWQCHVTVTPATECGLPPGGIIESYGSQLRKLIHNIAPRRFTVNHTVRTRARTP